MEGSHRGPAWPPSLELLEQLADEGLCRRTFLRLDRERRCLVLEAAFEEAAERGPTNLNIKEVAERAKVPVGSLYQYFGGRDLLVRFVCRLASERLVLVLTEARAKLMALPFTEALESYLKAGIDWCKSEPTLMRIYATAAYNVAFVEEAPDPKSTSPDQVMVEAIARAMQQVARSLVEAAGQRGELRDGIDLETACRVLNVVMIGGADAALLPGLNAYYRLYDRRHGHRRILEAVVDFAARGLLK